MRIASRWFGDSDVYARLAKALEYSIRVNAPKADCDVVHASSTPIHRYPAFLEKVRSWTDIIQRGKERECIALLDVDTLVMGPLDAAFSNKWDVAVTVRDARDRINSGAVYVTVTEYSQAFMREWLRRTEASDNKRFWDQDALIAQCDAEKKRRWPVRELQCHVWNCEQSSWRHLSIAKVVHVKSDARKRIFYDPKYTTLSPNAMAVVRLWKQYERMANQPGRP